jgi:hypothetical protein
LTQRPNDRPKDDLDERQQHQMQTLLPTKRLDPKIWNESSIPEIWYELASIQMAIEDDDDEPINDPPLVDLVRKQQQKDKFCKHIIKLVKSKARICKEMSLSYCTIVDSALYYQDWLYVPGSGEMQWKVI